MSDLRSLAEAATPGPWTSLVHGTASQRDAAGRAYEAVMAVRAADSPDIEFTDLSWVDLPDGVHVALVGNGPMGPENAHYIAAADPQTVLALLDQLAARDREVAALREALDEHIPQPGRTADSAYVWCGCGWDTIDHDYDMSWPEHVVAALAATPSTEEAGS